MKCSNDINEVVVMCFCLCDKCTKMVGVIVLVLGVLFLLRDLNVWNFWNVQWWTALFLLCGLAVFSGCNCPECKAKKK